MVCIIGESKMTSKVAGYAYKRLENFMSITTRVILTVIVG